VIVRHPAFIALATLAAACAEERPRPEDSACPTWKDDVGPALADACGTCHGAAAPGGDYRLDSYLGALGPGSDATANAVAGDPLSLLVTAIAPAGASEPHTGFGEVHALVARWVTSCDLAYFDTPIHAGGILDPSSGEFHGREVERRGWDLPLCATCHGADLSGSTKAPSCTTCHQQGPTACDTCHPARPTSNAHPGHLERGVGCDTCHAVPDRWDAPGHILVDGTVGNADPAPAEVALGGAAALTIDPADRTGPPTYDPATRGCAQVYCHGDVLGNAGGLNPRPRWNEDPPGPAACSSCHGEPPPSHARSRCAECHPGAGQVNHIDGAIDVGDGTPSCSGCHGSATSAAPPRDLTGNTLTSAIGVGAHQAHLQGLHRLATPTPCSACHAVPAAVTSPGHLDSVDPAEVAPALGWDRATATCASAWCHGAARPTWTDDQRAYCGSCHGIPPSTPPHLPTTSLTDCATCHPSSVDAFGNVRFSGPPGNQTSTHINGVAP
jgi:predicted CxxxxCH...CXXCH cytochrome family protein